MLVDGTGFDHDLEDDSRHMSQRPRPEPEPGSYQILLSILQSIYRSNPFHLSPDAVLEFVALGRNVQTFGILETPQTSKTPSAKHRLVLVPS